MAGSVQSTVKRLRPFFKYYGSKYNLAPVYPAPLYDTIIEPFAGSAQYSTLHYDRNVILLDKDERIAGAWDFLIHVSESEFMRLPLLDDGTLVKDLPIIQEARWFIGFNVNAGASVPCNMLTTYSKASPNAFWGAFHRERLCSQLKYIRHWRAVCADYTHTRHMHTGPATYFVDPPYQVMGRRYRKSSKEIDFNALGDWCRTRDGQVMVCENEGADWLPFVPFTRLKGTAKSNTEALWLKGC